MTDPTDKELLEFVARFAGWRDLQLRGRSILFGKQDTAIEYEIPDYLRSVDAWLRDVWPVVHKHRLADKWHRAFLDLDIGRSSADDVNADARSRCLALYRALEGKLQ